MTERPAKTGRKQDGTFAKGRSGNPRGRSQGSRNGATIVLEKMMTDEGEAVVQAVLTAAKSGDIQAARIVLDRIVPPRKGRPARLDLPPLETAAGVVDGLTALIDSMSRGELTPEEAAVVAGVIDVKRRAIETVDLEQRIVKLEAKAGP